MAFPPLDVATKRDRIGEMLREALFSGDLQPGERIVESRIARQLGVSQGPVREALVELEREGLVVRAPNRGAFVATLDDEEMEELLSLRAVLEGYCARLVSTRLRPDDRITLDALLEEMRGAAREGDLSALTQVDLRFHDELYRLSGHVLLGEVLSGLRQRMRLALALADAAYSTDLHDVARSHVPLVAALAGGDPDVAEKAARHHVVDGFKSSTSSAKLTGLNLGEDQEGDGVGGS